MEQRTSDIVSQSFYSPGDSRTTWVISSCRSNRRGLHLRLMISMNSPYYFAIKDAFEIAHRTIPRVEIVWSGVPGIVDVTVTGRESDLLIVRRALGHRVVTLSDLVR